MHPSWAPSVAPKMIQGNPPLWESRQSPISSFCCITKHTHTLWSLVAGSCTGRPGEFDYSSNQLLKAMGLIARSGLVSKSATALGGVLSLPFCFFVSWTKQKSQMPSGQEKQGHPFWLSLKESEPFPKKAEKGTATHWATKR